MKSENTCGLANHVQLNMSVNRSVIFCRWKQCAPEFTHFGTVLWARRSDDVAGGGGSAFKISEDG